MDDVKCVDCLFCLVSSEVCKKERIRNFYSATSCDDFVSSQPIRTFEAGATRDTAQGKLDYVRALSPIALRRYVQYLDKHRLQSDGTYRDFDNWKKGLPNDTCLSSLGRHYWDVWLLMHGYQTSDNHGPVDIKSALCGTIFNAITILHNIEDAELKPETSGGC